VPQASGAPRLDVRSRFVACLLLAYGTRDPNDIAYYPRSRKVFWRGVGLVARIDHLDYWVDED
jgi:hypothetical protein